MRLIHTLFYLVIITVTVIFAFSNSNDITIVYYFGEATIPLSLALGLALVIGCLLGLLISLKSILKLKYHQRSLKKEIDLANKEISNLRAIPIKDQH